MSARGGRISYVILGLWPSGCLSPRKAAICRIKYFHEVPGWRNWQTQRTQNPPVLSTLGVRLPLPAPARINEKQWFTRLGDWMALRCRKRRDFDRRFCQSRIIWQFFDGHERHISEHWRRRALEDKRIAMGRNAEAIKESFQSVTGHDKTKIFLAFGCQIQQPLPDGRRQMQPVSSGERLQVWLY